MNQNISLLNLKRQYDYMKEKIDTALKSILVGQNWILGPEVSALEKKIAEYQGCGFAVGVASGTDALVLALRALAIKLKKKEYFEKDDLIITTPFTFTATADAILRSGATPLFVDISPDNFNIDSRQIEKCFASRKHQNIVGIIPVHLYGQSCDMENILALAKKEGVFVLEDVAQAFGCSWQKRKLGSIGDAGALSFFPSKNLGSFGDAGMVVTVDQILADLVRMLTKHGGKDKYNAGHIGYNSRLDTIQAAILLVRLQYLEEFNQKRKVHASFYAQQLKNVPGLQMPVSLYGADHVYHQYTIRIGQGKRDALQKNLKDAGIATAVYYPVPLHKMAVFKQRCHIFGELKEAEVAAEQVLSLPIDPLMTNAELEFICRQIKVFLE